MTESTGVSGCLEWVRVGEGDTRKKLLKSTKKLLVVMDMSIILSVVIISGRHVQMIKCYTLNMCRVL